MLERLANIFNLIKLGVINYAIAMFVFDNNVDEMFVEKNILSFINVRSVRRSLQCHRA